MNSGKAVILVSGGIDSTTCLAIAREQDYECFGLSFDYGQRHRSELQAAARVARYMQVAEYKVLELDMRGIGGSALTDSALAVPEQETAGIPVTYVPARNTVFLSLALAWAEVLEARAIYIGVNALDYSGYPDCRSEFIAAFQQVATLATRAGIEGKGPVIETPLISMSKADIIRTGIAAGVDYSLTVSCYQADEEGKACGLCDSCRFRRKGFLEAGVPDPTQYQGSKCL
jgi:7-cyano-7-deazaguanine synthase